MTSIRLNNADWTFDETKPLGPPGGFGEVFEGEGAAGPVAVKRLNLRAGHAAHRELVIGKALANRALQHVVPILDAGQDANSDRYFLVMPVCSGSLQDVLDQSGALEPRVAREALLDILAGLREADDIVHRDLKPGNVLSLNDRWCLADFGIAKFVEDSTSLLTLRENLTPSYAAPEQWRGEAPTRATDVYALGCVAYALYSGRPPFIGSLEAIRRAHLEETPPALAEAGPRVSGFVGQMLRKTGASRPSIDRCEQVFRAEDALAKPAHAGLQAAATHVAQQVAEEEARRAAEAARKAEREAQVKEALSELRDIVGRLVSTIQDASEEANLVTQGVALGSGLLQVTDRIGTTGSGKPGQGQSGWTVLAYATISIAQQPPPAPPRAPHAITSDDLMGGGRDVPYVWAATLAFSATPADKDFRWREVSFWSMSQRGVAGPRGLPADGRDFDLALSNVMHTWNVAFGPVPIDGEDESNFQHRWLTLFSRAAMGQLSGPGQMPVPPSFFG